MRDETMSQRLWCGIVMILVFGVYRSPRTLSAEPSEAAIRAAVSKSVPLIEASLKEHSAQRDCFSCHHHGVGVVALRLAEARGFAIDKGNLADQVEVAETHLKGGIDDYRKGKGQGGGTTTAGYALWALDAAGRPRNDVSAAVVDYLLQISERSDHWTPSSDNRPPSEASNLTATFVALRALKAFGTPGQADRINATIARARPWLIKTPAKDHEDRVFRLLALDAAKAGTEVIRSAANLLQGSQRPDGGWAQIEGGASDAYATGSALYALHRAGALSTDDPSYRRGLAFLIKTQRPDGSWYVKSRTRVIIQKYFESGFPHGKDQFISISGTSWAVMALAIACPVAGR
jgi:hypothetical protein